MIRPRVVVLCLLATLLPPAASAEDPSIVGQIELTSELSPEEMIQAADAILVEMDLAVGEITQLLAASERNAEMARIQCLSKSLTTMRALAEVTATAVDTMKHALAAGASDQAAHELRKITIARGKFQRLKAEAYACVGTVAGDETVTVTVSGAGLDVVDETEELEFDLDTDAPPPTSQFQ